MTSNIIFRGYNESTRVEYLIVHPPIVDDMEVYAVIFQLLSDALDANQNTFEDIDIAEMLKPDVQRSTSSKNTGTSADTSVLYGFVLELPAETTRPEQVVQEFTAALTRTPPITHALKFYDSLLLRHNIQIATELFEIEMKLRRVLSIIYLHRSPSKPYELLRDEVISPTVEEKLTPEQLTAAVENELFHLTFGQYPRLNQRKLPGKIAEIVPLVREAISFERFREELKRMPVENEDDQLFISGLKDALGTVFTVRNCIAHNRTIPRRALENYEKNARPALEKLLNEYLERWVIEPASEETPWEYETRRAIEEEMARAEWDASSGTVRFVGDDEPYHQDIEIRDRDALALHLERIAEVTWCAFRPSYGEGDSPEPEVEGMVDDVMDAYADQIAAVFKAVENGESET